MLKCFPYYTMPICNIIIQIVHKFFATEYSLNLHLIDRGWYCRSDFCQTFISLTSNICMALGYRPKIHCFRSPFSDIKIWTKECKPVDFTGFANLVPIIPPASPRLSFIPMIFSNQHQLMNFILES